MQMAAKARAAIAIYVWLIAVVGCTSTKVTDREKYEGRRLARPNRIVVHDFAYTTAGLPQWSEARDRVAASRTPLSAEQIETGRQLGSQVAADLVAEIREMGLPAFRSAGQPALKQGDIALVGYFASIDEGSRMKRVVIGFGSGTAELTTRVEGYLATDSGIAPPRGRSPR